MKKANFIVLLLVVLTVGFWLESPAVSNSQSIKGDSSESDNVVAGELLVKFKDDAARQNLSSIHTAIGATVTQEFAELGWQHVRLPEGLSVKDAIARYKQSGDVAEAQPNFVYRISLTPNDTQFNSLYGMTKINAPAAWEITTGSPSVVVAIIDTGMNFNHEDLIDNLWTNAGEIAGNGIDDDANGFVDDVNGYNFVTPGGNNADDNSHGSHCAGTIGAVGNNGKGVAGVNWNVKMMGIKTHDGAAGASTSLRVIGAYNYVTMMKNRGVNIRVTSNSYGGAPEAAAYDQATKDAIDAAGRADILNVFAAGNDNFNNDQTPTYPGSYNSPSILTVAASDSNDNKASFSSYGLTTVDVAAPGVGILSTVLNQAYGSKSGTSMATPHTAGAAALLAAANPALSAASLKATLMNTVDPFAVWSGKTVTGGRIDVLQAIQNPTVCTFNAAPVGSTNFASTGGSGSFTVTAPTNCGYTGFPSATWITANPGSGNGAVTYTVAPNTSLSSRSATMNIAGQTFTINQSAFNPTAANAAIAGRVVTENGRGVRSVSLELIGSDGQSRYARTNSFGYYRFAEIPVGETYVITASGKRHIFTPETQSINLVESVEDVNFTALNR